MELLVFPTSRALRAYVNSLKKTNQLLPKLITIDEFFSRSITIDNQKYIDNDLKFLYLKESINFSEFDMLGIKKDFASFLKQSEYIFSFFNELSLEMKSIDDIDLADTYAFYKDHLDVLKQVYQNYVRLLEENNYIDKSILPKKYKLNEKYLKEFDSITIHHFGLFNRFEFDLIDKVSKVVDTNIKLKTNSFNKKTAEQFSAFDLKENCEAIINLSKNEKEEQSCATPSYGFDIKSFSSRIYQIPFIKASIYDMVQNKGFDASQIVVIVPDETFVSQIKLFDKEGYFNYAMGIDIKNTRLFKAMYAIYEYCNALEQKEIAKLAFNSLDKNSIDNIFLKNWADTVSLEKFKEITTFLKDLIEDDELYEKFNDQIYSLEKLLFSTHITLTLNTVYKIMMQRISGLTLDDVNSGNVTVMGLLETRGVNYRGVIVVDFNDDIVPKKSLKDKFLSSQVKYHAGLPTNKDREDLQKFYYKSLFDGCEELHISYVSNDQRSISRFANEIFDLKGLDLSVADKSYVDILYSEFSYEHFDKDITLAVDMSKYEWSASSLKTFLQCKRKYYYQKILGLKEHDFLPYPKGSAIGTIIHDILENSFIDGKLDIESFDEKLNLAQKENRYLTLELELWRARLKNFANNEISRVNSGAIVRGVEKAFHINHKGITLKGKIDRIDEFDDRFEILDYKTSSALKVDTIKNYEKSNDFQLEFYFLALKGEVSKPMKVYYYDLFKNMLLEEIALEPKLQLLDSILDELHTKEVNFSKCDDKSVCQFCPYVIICDKE